MKKILAIIAIFFTSAAMAFAQGATDPSTLPPCKASVNFAATPALLPLDKNLKLSVKFTISNYQSSGTGKGYCKDFYDKPYMPQSIGVEVYSYGLVSNKTIYSTQVPFEPGRTAEYVLSKEVNLGQQGFEPEETLGLYAMIYPVGLNPSLGYFWTKSSEVQIMTKPAGTNISPTPSSPTNPTTPPSQNSAPKVLADPSSPTWGQSITFSSQNLQSGDRVKIIVNNKTILEDLTGSQLSQKSLFVNQQNNFTETGRNAVQAVITRNGNTISNTQLLSFDPSQAGSGGKQGGPSTPADPKLAETLFNPLPTDSLTGTILTIAKGFLAIVALWAVVFIIIGGFRMVLSQGNEEAYLAAKKTITWAVLGVVVAMLSFSIIAIVQSLLGVTVPDFPGSQTPVVKNQETNK